MILTPTTPRYVLIVMLLVVLVAVTLADPSLSGTMAAAAGGSTTDRSGFSAMAMVTVMEWTCIPELTSIMGGLTRRYEVG